MDYMAAQMDRQIEGAISENDLLVGLLENIAALAHDGGLLSISESDALCAVRRLTLNYWRGDKQIHERTEIVEDALCASVMPNDLANR